MDRKGIRGQHKKSMFDNTKDEVAESLERRGFWRRAANRWGAILLSCHDSELRELYAHRREECISRANASYRQRHAEYED